MTEGRDMKYIKVLGLKDCDGIVHGNYSSEEDTISVNFECGMLHAIIVSFHEVLHALVFAYFPSENWLDLAENWVEVVGAFLDPEVFLKPKRMKKCFKWIYGQMAHL